MALVTVHSRHRHISTTNTHPLHGSRQANRRDWLGQACTHTHTHTCSCMCRQTHTNTRWEYIPERQYLASGVGERTIWSHTWNQFTDWFRHFMRNCRVRHRMQFEFVWVGWWQLFNHLNLRLQRLSSFQALFFYLKRERNHISSCIHMLFNTENISSSCQEACQCRRDVSPEMMAILSLGNVKTFGKKRWIKMIWSHHPGMWEMVSGQRRPCSLLQMSSEASVLTS